MKPALIVIGVQNESLPCISELDVKPAPDSPGFQFMPSVTVLEDDPKVLKNYPGAFKKTELEKLLRDQGINTLLLCGLSSTGCVLATCHGALDLDYDVFMVKSAAARLQNPTFTATPARSNHAQINVRPQRSRR